MAMARQTSTNSHRKARAGGSRRGDERSKTYPPPYANGLLIRLIVQPSFLKAASLQDAPAVSVEENDATQMQLVDWNRLEELLQWFASGCASDDTANLTFSSTLHQHHRSQIHRLADQIGLDSFSQGVGKQRHVSLYAKGKAPAKALINDVTQKKAKILYLLAKATNIPASQDECAEMLAGDTLTPELKDLWESEGKTQLEIVRLNQCASRGLLDDLRSAIDANPELVKSGKAEVASTLTPLNCAAAQGHVDCLQALLDAGAPIEAMDGFGHTALQASRRFEQQETEAVLIRAGAEDQLERDDSVTSQSDLAELVRALPRGHKESAAVDRLTEIEEFDDEPGFNRPVRSSFENLSQLPSIEEKAAAEALAEPISPKANGEQHTTLQRTSSQSKRKDPKRQSSLPRVPSGLVNPMTGALSYGHAIARQKTAEMALNSSLNMDMRREYEASPNLRGDPKAATRGSRGAAAMALGRRIMESAHHQEARRQQSQRISEGDAMAAREAVTQSKDASKPGLTPPREGQTLQAIFNPLNQPLSLTSARMNGRFGHGKQTSKQRINAWMESAPEEHSTTGLDMLTHSVSNPQLVQQQSDEAKARADSAPEPHSELIGNENFDIKEPTQIHQELYDEIDAMDSRPATEKNVRVRAEDTAD